MFREEPKANGTSSDITATASPSCCAADIALSAEPPKSRPINDGKEVAADVDADVGLKMLLLGLVVVQTSGAVLVGRYTRALASKQELFDVNHMLIVTELVKVREIMLNFFFLEESTAGKSSLTIFNLHDSS